MTDRLKRLAERVWAAFEWGVVLAVKIAIPIVVVLFTVNYLLDIQRAALDGVRALAVIQAYQRAGVLPTDLQRPAPPQAQPQLQPAPASPASK